MKWRITQVTLINDNSIARILNTLFKVKLLALVEQVLALLKRNFPTYFCREKFPGNCSSEFLLVAVVGLYSKGFLSNTRKASQDRKKTIQCALQSGFSEKKKRNFSRKISMLETCFRNVTREFMTTRLQHGNFPRNIPTIFGTFICLVSQIVIVLIRLHQGNCLSVIGDYPLLKTLVKCHKCLKETERFCFPKSCSSEKLFWKV